MSPALSDAGEEKKSYYDGDSSVAQETPVTASRLEARRKLTKNSTRLVIALVGLPARGKSFVARKLLYYFNWSGVECKIFNVGRYRREAYAEMQAEEEAAKTTVRKQPGACDADFFDSHNAQASQLRERVAELALRDMLKWLDYEDDEGMEACCEAGGSMMIPQLCRHSSVNSQSTRGSLLSYHNNERIAIFDATNSTEKRRQWILDECTAPHKRPDKPTGVVFVESICDDTELLEENYRYKVSNSPDFEGMGLIEALADLKRRVQKYEEQYETVANDSMSYIKIFNLSTKLMVNHMYGRMAKELVPALMAWHIGSRPIFLCRPGQTLSGILTDGEDYVSKQRMNYSPADYAQLLDLSARTRKRTMRGDTLGPHGERFREALLQWCKDEVHDFMHKRASVRDMTYTGTSISGLDPGCSTFYSAENFGEGTAGTEPFPMRIYTSTMPRAAATVTWEGYDFTINQQSNLNPQDKGDFAGMELDEIEYSHPAWYAKLENDPYGTRFPGGECYRDLIKRLTTVVVDMEQQVIPTLVVSHVSILQCLIAYFRNTPVDRCMSIEVPMHSVIKFTPVRGGGWSESLHSFEKSDKVNRPSIVAVESEGEMSALNNESFSAGSTPIWGDHSPTVRTKLIDRCIPESLMRETA